MALIQFLRERRVSLLAALYRGLAWSSAPWTALFQSKGGQILYVKWTKAARLQEAVEREGMFRTLDKVREEELPES